MILFIPLFENYKLIKKENVWQTILKIMPQNIWGWTGSR